MAENGSELRSIAWSQSFPFVRLFRTLRLALGVNRLLLALACVVLSYLGGRILDGIWGQRHGVAALAREAGVRNEIEVYSEMGHAEYAVWRREARQAPERMAFQALRQFGKAANEEEARKALADKSLRELLLDAEFRGELTALGKVVAEQLKTGLDALDKNKGLSAEEREEQRDELVNAADTVRRMLAGLLPRGPLATTQGAKAVELLAGVDPQTRADVQGRLTKAAARQAQLRDYEQLRPRGPFISLLKYEDRCFTMAIHGVCTGRWGFSGGAMDPQPSLGGSLLSAVSGVCWLVNQRPWFALFSGLFNLLVFAYFGGAICRSAAVQLARDEGISLGEALRFARQRLSGFILAPLMPIGVLIGILVLMFLGGLFGAVGYVGELFTGVFYPLALLGGFAAAVLVLVTALAFHLMWPTIAVEGSDGFDALSRSCSYVGSRIWHVLFYTFVLLLYGAASFVLVRLVLMFTLKLAHRFTGLGMNLISSAELDGTGKLNAIWSMPAWSDLTLLPGPSSSPIWGSFANGPLDATETLAYWLIAIWVFLTVSLLGAFVVNYFFCGSTQIYFLLRREVDATDYDDVYYEETQEPAPVAPPEPAPAGTETPAAPTAEAPPTGPETPEDSAPPPT